MATVDDFSLPYLTFADQASDPAAPAAGFRRIYTKSGGFYEIDSAGTITGPFGAGSAGTAAGTTFTPAGSIAATNVQAAIEEVAAEASSGGLTDLWVPATAFVANGASSGSGATLTNTPTTAFAGRMGVWLFDQTIEETIGTQLMVPATWTTFEVDVWWANASTGAGAVVWTTAIGFFAAADSVNAGYSVPGSVTSTAGAQYIAVVASAVGGTLTNQSGEMFSLRVVRSGGNAADDLGNDAALMGVRLRQVS